MQACPHCKSMFISEKHLDGHIARRHPETLKRQEPGPPPPPPATAVDIERIVGDKVSSAVQQWMQSAQQLLKEAVPQPELAAQRPPVVDVESAIERALASHETREMSQRITFLESKLDSIKAMMQSEIVHRSIQQEVAMTVNDQQQQRSPSPRRPPRHRNAGPLEPIDDDDHDAVNYGMPPAAATLAAEVQEALKQSINDLKRGLLDEVRRTREGDTQKDSAPVQGQDERLHPAPVSAMTEMVRTPDNDIPKDSVSVLVQEREQQLEPAVHPILRPIDETVRSSPPGAEPAPSPETPEVPDAIESRRPEPDAPITASAEPALSLVEPVAVSCQLEDVSLTPSSPSTSTRAPSSEGTEFSILTSVPTIMSIDMTASTLSAPEVTTTHTRPAEPAKDEPMSDLPMRNPGTPQPLQDDPSAVAVAHNQAAPSSEAQQPVESDQGSAQSTQADVPAETEQARPMGSQSSTTAGQGPEQPGPADVVMYEVFKEEPYRFVRSRVAHAPDYLAAEMAKLEDIAESCTERDYAIMESFIIEAGYDPIQTLQRVEDLMSRHYVPPGPTTPAPTVDNLSKEHNATSLTNSPRFEESERMMSRSSDVSYSKDVQKTLAEQAAAVVAQRQQTDENASPSGSPRADAVRPFAKAESTRDTRRMSNPGVTIPATGDGDDIAGPVAKRRSLSLSDTKTPTHFIPTAAFDLDDDIDHIQLT